MCPRADLRVIHRDWFYRDARPGEDPLRRNYDHPDAFDDDLLRDTIIRVKRGESVVCPDYDYVNHCRSSTVNTVPPGDVIVIEGILLLHDSALLKLADRVVFVSTRGYLRMARRILRDIKERGRTLESALHQIVEQVEPSYLQYMKPYKNLASIIVYNNGTLAEMMSCPGAVEIINLVNKITT
jgi:uridine kinase